jgi:hypothetical protein
LFSFFLKNFSLYIGGGVKEIKVKEVPSRKLEKEDPCVDFPLMVLAPCILSYKKYLAIFKNIFFLSYK